MPTHSFIWEPVEGHDADPHPSGFMPGRRTARFHDVEGYEVVLTLEATLWGESAQGMQVLCHEACVRWRGEDDDAQPVMASTLRAIPLGGLLDAAINAWADELYPATAATGDEGDDPASAAARSIGMTVNGLAERVADAREAGPTTRTLTLVAEVYRRALYRRRHPTRAVEEVFGIPRSTAGRWVGLARQRGALGPAEGAGKAGG